MEKYIKKFESHTDYQTYINSGNAVLPNVSYCEQQNEVHYNNIPNNIITYEASAKLTETSSYGGLKTSAFNTTIASHDFSNGKGTITFAEDVTSVGKDAFYGSNGMTSIKLPNTVRTIGQTAFKGCTNLESAIIPNKVTQLGAQVFLSCTSLASVSIGSGLTVLDNSLFYNCTALTNIVIPSTVTEIKSSVFSYCTSLISVTCLATTPPTLGYSSFYNNASGRKIYVPANSVNAYKSADNWNTYASDIEAIS